MPEIYMPERHEPLSGAPWSAQRASEAIDEIAHDFATSVRADSTWPNHPLDDGRPGPRRCAYFGAAGAISTLRILSRAGYATEDFSDRLRDLHTGFLDRPDIRREPGLQLGEIGILAPAVLADPSNAALTRRLDASMTEIIGHPAREITSGETGMMHAALTLYRETGNANWADHFRAGAESLWKNWQRDSSTGAWLWTHDIFSSVRTYYGACHGVAGNVGALLRGADLLAESWTDLALARAHTTLAQGAVSNGADVNWRVSADPTGQRRLVQWCHGAPGVITALAPVTAPLPELLSLLVRAGEFVWKAGPLVKGSGLCHGTAGNGYAFLALYHATKDATWLDRARRFAMHAIDQSEAARCEFGQSRYALWTGDGGLAVYLHDCIDPTVMAFPGLDRF